MKTPQREHKTLDLRCSGTFGHLKVAATTAQMRNGPPVKAGRARDFIF